jgi:uncharacterized protein
VGARPDLVVRTGGDPARFAERTASFLTRLPALHNVVLTRLGQSLVGDRATDERWWWVERDGEVVMTLMQTPPHGVYLAGACAEAAETLAEALWVTLADGAGGADGAGEPPPSVGGPTAVSTAFARRWHRLGGPPARVLMRQGTLVCERLSPAPVVPGRERLATAADLPVLRSWGDAFAREAVPNAPPRDHVSGRVAQGLLRLWDVDGRPVSMVARTEPAAQVTRISLVYTPPSLRGNGYAAACVAAVTADQLAVPGRSCVLYTDLANPTSNALYRRLGYRQVSEALDLAFG